LEQQSSSSSFSTANKSGGFDLIMENTLLVTLSRQITLQRKMDVIANNMANINTAGYKGESLKFEEYLMPVAEMTGMTGADKNVTFVQDPRMVRNLSEGAVRQTGNELDIAVSGDGWLVVNTPQGERYTRNGQLSLSNEGILVTSEGYPVLGQGGEISITTDDGKVTIGKDGTVATEQGVKDRLRLVEFASPEAMSKQGASTYSSKETPTDAENTQVIQGAYEASNVQAMREMTDMISTVRAYSSISRTMEAVDETRGKAIQELGRVET
jgi:flagellar basal-body rod protein FlgF